jgi:hypothetical protein
VAQHQIHQIAHQEELNPRFAVQAFLSGSSILWYMQKQSVKIDFICETVSNFLIPRIVAQNINFELEKPNRHKKETGSEKEDFTFAHDILQFNSSGNG